VGARKAPLPFLPPTPLRAGGCQAESPEGGCVHWGMEDTALASGRLKQPCSSGKERGQGGRPKRDRRGRVSVSPSPQHHRSQPLTFLGSNEAGGQGGPAWRQWPEASCRVFMGTVQSHFTDDHQALGTNGSWGLEAHPALFPRAASPLPKHQFGATVRQLFTSLLCSAREESLGLRHPAITPGPRPGPQEVHLGKGQGSIRPVAHLGTEAPGISEKHLELTGQDSPSGCQDQSHEFLFTHLPSPGAGTLPAAGEGVGPPFKNRDGWMEWLKRCEAQSSK
jgi:hypothetical protein